VKKVPKMQARYRKTASKTRNCHTCRYMRDNGMCDKVAGPVERDHVSDLYEAKP
jgi:hypothetical protein